MTSALRAIARFWFLAVLLLLLTVLQLGLKPSPLAGSSPLALVWSREPAAGLLGTPTPTATPSAQPPTGTPTSTSTATATPTSTATSTPSPTPTPTAPDTSTPAPSLSAQPPLGTPSDTATPTSIPTPTFTPTPLPTPDGSRRTARVPILMYHYISVPPAGSDVYRRDLSVKPAEFEAQLAWLRSQGYQGIRLADLVYYLTQGRPLPEKPVILTFDDGYRDNYTNALPLLLKYGYAGTFFLVTRSIDDQDPAYLSWDMVKEMHQAGMDMEPHGYRHYDLNSKDVDFLVYEIVGAKEAIEARTGETCRFFAYPSGSYNRNTIAVLRSAYFWGAVVTEQGITHESDHPFELERIRIRGRFTVQDFADLFTYKW